MTSWRLGGWSGPTATGLPATLVKTWGSLDTGRVVAGVKPDGHPVLVQWGGTLPAHIFAVEGEYAAADHNHDDAYAAADHDHDDAYAAADHNHDGDYLPVNDWWGSNPTTTTKYLPVFGAAYTTVNLDAGADTALPNVEIIGANAAPGTLHLALWQSPASPTANHRLVGVRIYGGNIDYGGFAETQTVVAIYATGSTTPALNDSVWSGDNLHFAPTLSNSDPASFYNQTFPILAEFYCDPIPAPSAGAYQVGLGFKVWSNATVPVLPDSFTVETVHWIFELAPVQIPAGTTSAIIDMSDIATAARNDYILPTIGEVPLSVWVYSESAMANDQVCRFYDSQGHFVGEVWANCAATFTAPGQMTSYGPAQGHQTMLNRVGYTATDLDRDRSGVRYANTTAVTPTVALSPGIPGLVVVDNVASDFWREADPQADWQVTVSLRSEAVDDDDNYALAPGGASGVVFSDTVLAGKTATYRWDPAARTYIRVAAT